jgi:hypothetical protein
VAARLRPVVVTPRVVVALLPRRRGVPSTATPVPVSCRGLRVIVGETHVRSHLYEAFAGVPWWFDVVGLVVSAYHPCRGYVFQCAYAHYQQSQTG